jgi:hypothetical protein
MRAFANDILQRCLVYPELIPQNPHLNEVCGRLGRMKCCQPGELHMNQPIV